jgi:hypothetical protein
LLGVYAQVGVVLLMIFLMGVSLQMLAFWKLDDSKMRQSDMINFTKNMALVGALLMFQSVHTLGRHEQHSGATTLKGHTLM